MSPSDSDLGVFVCAKREAAADGTGGSSAAAGSPVAAGWLGKGCGMRGVRALRLLHRAVQSGKQRRAWAAPRRNVTYRLYCVVSQAVKPLAWHVVGCVCCSGLLNRYWEIVCPGVIPLQGT